MLSRIFFQVTCGFLSNVNGHLEWPKSKLINGLMIEEKRWVCFTEYLLEWLSSFDELVFISMNRLTLSEEYAILCKNSLTICIESIGK